MKSIVLAAGRGSRLGDLTASSPKTLTELSGKPLLQWQLDTLRAANVKNCCIVTGYCAEALAAYGDMHIYNPEWDSTNIFGSLLCASERLSAEAHIVSYGDIVYRTDIVRRLIACPADIAITYDELWLDLWRKRFVEPLTDAECFMQEGGWLQKVGGHATTLAEIQGQYMGLLKITPHGWRQICDIVDAFAGDQRKNIDMTTLLSLLLSKGMKIAAVPVRGGWVEVDTPTDIMLYQKLATTENWLHDWRSFSS
ncbi:phosphocholine cytidylyltransferase family protein [Rheinheimera sp. FR7-31]|uniref:phosphocholine cytidylyltransferase family protein n=1 Tax=Rheinheimera fenheensis TaxID=3152295 RepID=UPI00325EBC87